MIPAADTSATKPWVMDPPAPPTPATSKIRSPYCGGCVGRRPLHPGQAALVDDEEGQVALLLPGPEGGVDPLVPLAERDGRARLAGRGLHHRQRGDQVGPLGVGRDHEGRPGLRPAELVLGLDQVDRVLHLVDQRPESLAGGPQLLDGLDLLADLLPWPLPSPCRCPRWPSRSAPRSRLTNLSTFFSSLSVLYW